MNGANPAIVVASRPPPDDILHTGAGGQRRIAVAEKIAFGVGRIVVEVVEEVPHVQLIVLREPVIALDHELIVLLSDGARNVDAAVGTRKRHVFHHVDR